MTIYSTPPVFITILFFAAQSKISRAKKARLIRDCGFSGVSTMIQRLIGDQSAFAVSRLKLLLATEKSELAFKRWKPL